MVSASWPRRLAATAVDYGLVVAYLGVLSTVAFAGRVAGITAPSVHGPAGRVIAQIVTSAVLSVPVTVAAALWEARRGATPGKRLLGLAVTTATGGRPGRGRSLVRNALKILLPWELAHTAIWDIVVWPGGGGTGIDTGLLIAVYALAGIYLVSLIVGTGRTPYDRLTGTTVIDGRLMVPW